MVTITEADVEQYPRLAGKPQLVETAHGPDLIPGERTDYGTVILEGRLRDAIGRLNLNGFPRSNPRRGESLAQARQTIHSS